MMPTGSRLLAFASRWFDPATVHLTFEPLVADWQREWREAPLTQRSATRRRGAIAFVATFTILWSRSLLLAPVPPHMARNVVVRAVTFIACVCGLISIPFMLDAEPATPMHVIFLVLLVLPSAIALALPFAAAFAVDGVRQSPDVSPAERLMIVRTSIAAIMLTVLFAGWISQWSGRALHETTRGETVGGRSFHVRELTITELLFDPALAAAYEPFTGGADRQTRIRRELQNRAALALLPLVLVWLRWRALAFPRSGWPRAFPAVASAAATAVAYVGLSFAGFRIEHEWSLTAGSSHWIPLSAFVLWGLTASLRHTIVARGIARLVEARS